MSRDLTCAGFLLGLAGVFWFAQGDYTEPVDALLPRFVLVVMAVLGLVVGAMALLRRRDPEGAPSPGAEPSGVTQRANAADEPEDGVAVEADGADPGTDGPGAAGDGGGAIAQEVTPTVDTGTEAAAVDRRLLAAAILVLVGWGVAFGLFGITLSGVVAFLVTATLIKRGFTGVRGTAVDVTVAVAFVLLCFLVFTRVLYVPLPVSIVLGI